MADGRLDTVLPLQNYFSVLFPDLETTTHGTLHVYDARGGLLGRRPFDLPAHAVVPLRVSEVLRDIDRSAPEGYGTLLCDIRVPPDVRRFLGEEPFYFWDRFYIAYVPAAGPPCFVHGVDKTYVAEADTGALVPFYAGGRRYTWVPEIPVDLSLYARFSVILVNRTDAPARLALTVADDADATRRWDAEVAPRGVHRFELTAAAAAGLSVRDLRLQVDGIPTRWGRPVVFKEFANGAISAMHC